MRSVNTLFSVIVERGKTDDSPNKNGNDVSRLFLQDERYCVDFAELFHVEQWEQYDTDQDAPYFGTWVNRHSLRVLTFCEGDWTAVQCENATTYNAELSEMNEYYHPGIAFSVYDKHRSVVHHMQDRTTFLIPQ